MTSTPSIAQLQTQIEASRARLAVTIDELSHRATPKAIMQRQKDSARHALVEQTHQARARFNSVMQDERGELRRDRIVALGAVGAGLVLLGILRRRRG